MERRLPKCALFGVWLDGQYNKCDACLKACKEALDKPMQKPLTKREVHALIDAGEDVAVYCDFNVWPWVK